MSLNTALRRIVAVAGWTSLGGALTFVGYTRKCRMLPIDEDDYLFNSTVYARVNPNRSPYMHDICLRKVPLTSIKPALLEGEGKLVEAFCAGVWSGAGYAAQRRFLERKYRGPSTANQLWDKEELQSSTYEVGTLVTDHFEVLSKTPESIIVRAGDSPTVQEPRNDDGLFEMTAVVKQDEGVAEFGLKSVFFNSKSGYMDNSGAPPMPWYVQWLHQIYDKVLMESAIRNVIS